MRKVQLGATLPKMVLVISQETFDQAVQENINDLGLSHEDAVVEAIHQFELQVHFEIFILQTYNTLFRA